MTSERDQLVAAIAALDGQRAVLGDAVVEAALGPMRAKLATLHAPQGEHRKQITVLFADVSGFTARSETMDPEEVRAEMNALWQRLDAAILDHGGRIDKHIGDAVMALWGTDVAREDDPERAILAALAMQGFLSPSAHTRAATLESALVPRPALSLRIGINTGLALLGEVGTIGEFTAMGDAINVASRLEQAAAPGTILISHDTYRHVRGVFRVTPQPPLTVKGKTDPLTVYTVVEAKPRAFRAPNRGIEGIETHLVGREAELRRLQDAFLTTVQTGTFQQVTLIGEAGLGKSRLLDEFRRWMEARPEPHHLFLGRADVDLSGQPYGLLRDLLFTTCAIQHSDPLSTARAKLEAGFRGFLAQTGERDAEIAHLLGHLVGLDFSASSHVAGIVSDAQQLRDRAFSAASRFFQAAAATGPAVLLLDDLHWADDGSLDLLDHVARELSRTRLLVVGLTRPTLLERRPDWAAGRPSQARLSLVPLSTGETKQLIEALLQRADVIPPSLRDLVVARAEGNPFYVEELIRMLIDEGAIQASGERWVVMPERLDRVHVPPTLTGVVQARLDALPIAERETLKRAAVVGQVFWDAAVVTLAQAADSGVVSDDRAEGTRRALQALPGRELVLRRVGSAFGGTAEYAFQHALGREVAYESVLLWQRRRYHAAAAAWLLAQAGERANEYADLLAMHYDRAGEVAAAAEWYARAGQHAEATHSLETAISAYTRALALLPSSGKTTLRLRCYAGLGEALHLRARHAEGLQAFEEMRAVAEAAGDAVSAGRAWVGLARSQAIQGDARTGLLSAERAVSIARAIIDPDLGAQILMARALGQLGWVQYRQGHGVAALGSATGALEAAQALGDQREVANAQRLLGAVHLQLAHYAAACEHSEAALTAYHSIGDRVGVATTLNNLGEIDRQRGQFSAAIRRFGAGLAVCEEIGYQLLETLLLNNRGQAQVEAGDYAAAEVDLRQAISQATRTKHFALGEMHRLLAEACLAQGRSGEALVAGHHAYQLAQGRGVGKDLGTAWRALGLIAAHLNRAVEVDGRLCDASECFGESLRILTEAGIAGERARTLRAWGQYQCQFGDRAQGERRWQEADMLFEQLDMSWERARMRERPERAQPRDGAN